MITTKFFVQDLYELNVDYGFFFDPSDSNVTIHMGHNNPLNFINPGIDYWENQLHDVVTIISKK